MHACLTAYLQNKHVSFFQHLRHMFGNLITVREMLVG